MQNTKVWNAGPNGDSLLCKPAAKGYDESAILHRLAWALVTGQSVKYNSNGALGLIYACRSRRHSTKSEYTDESAQEPSGPIKLSYENARMCSHEWAFAAGEDSVVFLSA